MATYRFKIVGVHYAVNPDSCTDETEIMHQRTARRLQELDETRPAVVLIPEPSNPVDARAVMARVMGERIGYVDKTQLDTLHALLQAGGGLPLKATIEAVEARKHGWMIVCLEADKDVRIEPQNQSDSLWKEWSCTLPVLPATDSQFARIEAEVMLDDVFSKHPTDGGGSPQSTQSSTESFFNSQPLVIQSEAKNLEDTKQKNIQVDAPEILPPYGRLDDKMGDGGQEENNPCESVESVVGLNIIEQYLRIWLNSSLHDLSNEARLTREHYIMRLRELESQNATPGQELSNRISALISAIEKQRTAICGQKRMNLRVDKWWKELLASKEMEQLWGMWTLHNEGNSEPSLSEIDTHLKALPNSLYAFVDRKKLFFSRLYYSHIPRKKYWQIVSLMLLKDRMQVEGGRESRPQVHSEMEGHRENHSPVLGTPPQEQTLDEPFTVVIPPELETPEAKKILTRLQKKGLLDKDFQPVGLSQAKRGVLAWELCDHLRIKYCWKVMEVLWKCKGETIRKARERGIDTDTVMEFNKKLKNVIY